MKMTTAAILPNKAALNCFVDRPNGKCPDKFTYIMQARGFLKLTRMLEKKIVCLMRTFVRSQGATNDG
jgi:hypothetical protein